MLTRPLTGHSIHLKALEAMPAAALLIDLGVVLALISAPLVSEFPRVLALYLIAMYALYLLGAARPRWRASWWMPLLFMILVIFGVLRYYRTLAGYEAGITFFTLLLGPKLLEINKRRDFNVTVTIGLFLVVLQFLLNQSLLKALYMLPLVVALFGVLIQSNRVKPLPRKQAFIAAVRMVAQALPVMLVMFVFFPRLNEPLWTLNLMLDRRSARTGLSDSMEPGAFQQLISSQEIAFRAEMQGKQPLPPWNLYWRGPVFWHTDGLRWHGGPPALPTTQPLHQQGRVNYRVVMEPNGKRWVLALDLPGIVPNGTKLTADFQVNSHLPLDQRNQFFLTSFLDYHTGPLTAREQQAALQIPRRPPTRRLIELVKTWQRHANGQPRRVVDQALTFFQQGGFTYSLNPPPLGTGGIASFLFDTKAGFCEHYAGAFAFLMRLANIPSRVVTGYLGGEYNELGDYYLVRQEYAHAWTEVWLHDVGWMRVDPTAAVAPERLQNGIVSDTGGEGAPVTFRISNEGWQGLLHDLNMVVDAINMRWHVWVLGYDTEKQEALLQSLGLGFLDRAGIAILLTLTVVSLGAILALFLSALDQPSATDISVQLYRRLCLRLAKIGILRPDREGPRDFASRVSRRRPDLAKDVVTMVNLYIRARYSSRGNANDLRELANRLADFHPQRL